MAETRSPRYPNISLSEAITKAKAIYSKEHMSGMTPQVAAEAMGYAGINGSSLKTISALKKYGLLDGRGDDVRLTKDAQTLIIDDPNSPDYRAAIGRAALAPEVYGEIKRQFPGVASERNISVYLEKQGFKPDAASDVAKNYKETMALVPDSEAAYSDARSDAASEATVNQPRQGVDTTIAPPAASLTATQGTPFRVVQDGKQLSISAVVDLKGLRKLKLMLDNYEKLLEMFEDDSATETPAN